jgi:hypothetical protein
LCKTKGKITVLYIANFRFQNMGRHGKKTKKIQVRKCMQSNNFGAFTPFYSIDQEPNDTEKGYLS